jgi:tRNA pseudouridine55 synthase
MAKCLHGLLVIDKPPGLTSRAAVDRAQRWLPPGTRVGHTGTLDPLATGVLVLCLGVATRLTEYVQDMAKTYRAGLRLGARSDTDDADGTVTLAEVSHVPERGEITDALGDFAGTIDQVPPSYSAAKVAGRRAYALARRGQAVALQARKITIHAIDVISYEYPRLEIEVRCGKGTYIRSLARDLGDKLGCGALIGTLRRTRVGPFGVEDAVTLDADAAVAQSRLLPLAAAVAAMPRVVVDQRAVLDLEQGRAVAYNSVGDQTFEVSQTSEVSAVGAALAEDGRLVAVGTLDVGQCRFVPEKVFNAIE